LLNKKQYGLKEQGLWQKGNLPQPSPAFYQPSSLKSKAARSIISRK